MKRVVLIFLSIILCFTCVACSNNTKTKTDENGNAITDKNESTASKKEDVLLPDEEALNPQLPTELKLVSYVENIFDGENLVFYAKHWNPEKKQLSEDIKDKDGTIIEEANYYVYNKNGKVIQKYEYKNFGLYYTDVFFNEYNSDGKLVKSKAAAGLHDDGSLKIDCNWIVEKKDPQISINDYPITCIKEYTYFDNGHEKTRSESYFYESGEDAYQNVFEYSMDGTLKTTRYEKGKYAYETNGTWKVTSESQTSQKDNVEIPSNGIIRKNVGSLIVEYKYSKNKYLIYETSYNSTTNEKELETVYQYDKQGKKIKTINYSKT